MRERNLTLISKYFFATIKSILLLIVFSNSWAVEENAKQLPPIIHLLLDDQGDAPPISSGAFIEEDGLIVVEMESLDLPQGWTLKNDDADALGSYIEWTDNNRLRAPGNGLISIKVAINDPGTYQFLWRSSIREGVDTTESNDSFLRILADNFYGFRSSDSSIVCPREQDDSNRCNGRDPEGASSDGWFKIYRSGGTPPDWIWVTRTSDSDAHRIYVDFDQAGEYEIQISGRSQFHAIDRLVLFRSLNDADNITENFATNSARPESDRAP